MTATKRARKLALALALSAAPAVCPAADRVTIFGDSIGLAVSPTTNAAGVMQLATDPFTAEVTNLAYSGLRFIDMRASFTPASVTGARLVLIEGGTMDVNELHVLPQTGQMVLDRLRAFAADVRAAEPAATLLVCTITPRVTPGDQVRIDEYNELLRAAWPTMADGIWDAAAVPGMGDPFRWDLYYDGLHPSLAGGLLLAPSLRSLLRSKMPDAVDPSYALADLNLDGLVDAADLEAGKANFVDGADLLAWQRGGPAQVGAIPEPDALTLALAALAATLIRRVGNA